MIKTTFQKLLRQNYNVTRFYHQACLQLSDLKAREKIIIYQMGKVGSTTLLNSLEALELTDTKIYHTHNLTPESIAKQESVYRAKFDEIRCIHSHLIHGQYLYNLIQDRRLKNFKIITLTRDPVARNISGFFQNLELFFNYNYRQKLQTMPLEAVVNELQNIFFEEVDHERPLRWFDDELKISFNFDIFQHNFYPDKGYEIYQSKDFKLLVLKQEKINHCADTALGEFLGIDNLTIRSANLGETKKYSNLYKTFLNSIHLPEWYLDKMYLSEYCQHFYSPEEIAAFREKWSRSSPSVKAN